MFLRFLMVFLFLGVSSYASAKELYLSAPSELPFTSRSMKSPGYWLSRHPSPEDVILSSADIKKFNDRIHDNGLTYDIFSYPEIILSIELKTSMEKNFKEIKDRRLFDKAGNFAFENKMFSDQMAAQVNITGIPEQITPEYGLIVHYADQRFLPTTEPLYAKRDDIDFDELQNSTLDVGTPVVILYKSADHKWFYVQSPSSVGWVEEKNIGLGTKDAIKDFLSKPMIAVVTAPKADIFLNNAMTEYYDYVRMGVTLPTLVEAPEKMRVTVPIRKDDGKLDFQTGYMNKDDINRGYLPYTAANIIRQAFRLLNAPYGWGGMYGEQDCSAFLQEVFATVGIMLPRDSKDQAKVGRVLDQFDNKSTDQDKLEALHDAPGGTAILPMPGHILLYLGMDNNRAYAIHAMWAYREPGGSGDRVLVVNRVIVSDLSLGEGSKKGSLLKRLSAIKFVGN